MATAHITGVRIAGVSASVPEQVCSWEDQATVFGRDLAAKISDATGVKHRRVAPPELCASDLCAQAAQRLLDDLGWELDSIDVLIFISQTPDYRLPATACVLQSRLGLSQSCAAFDLSLGCSGYVYGLWVASQMIGPNRCQRVLVLAGDTVSRLTSPDDQSTAGLFGDAGSATALEYDPRAQPMVFQLGTDGEGEDSLRVPAGGARLPIGSPEESYLQMDGADVFAFTLKVVPGLVRRTLDSAGWTVDSLDRIVMHQANTFLLNHLSKRLKAPAEKRVLALDGFGNTSCASIPLAMCNSLSSELTTRPQNLLLVGFGVGWSWGAVT
ncbi:MAG: 3-oxoacyl-ACP synthase III family protein, partial [Aeoliella sp.]